MSMLLPTRSLQHRPRDVITNRRKVNFLPECFGINSPRFSFDSGINMMTYEEITPMISDRI